MVEPFDCHCLPIKRLLRYINGILSHRLLMTSSSTLDLVTVMLIGVAVLMIGRVTVLCVFSLVTTWSLGNVAKFGILLFRRVWISRTCICSYWSSLTSIYSLWIVCYTTIWIIAFMWQFKGQVSCTKSYSSCLLHTYWIGSAFSLSSCGEWWFKHCSCVFTRSACWSSC